MGQKLVLGPLTGGLRTDVLPFNIDNTSFPVLINAYQWRGRVKRKRGTEFLNRLMRYIAMGNSSYTGLSSFALTSGSANLVTVFSLESTANIVPGSVTLTDSTLSVNFTDNGTGGLVGNNMPPTMGTINYSTGAITIGSGNDTISAATFSYYPSLPVLGLEDVVVDTSSFPDNLAFDTTYAYNISPNSPYNITDASFYKSPSTGLTGFVPKTLGNPTPLTWENQNYQQFWSVNYQGAFWVTPNVQVPYPYNSSTINVGLQFKPIVAVTNITTGPPAIARLQITGHGLIVGDFIFVNEVVTTTGINLQTGYVIAVVDTNHVTVEFPYATINTNGTGGIAQYLTNTANSNVSCIRWYDGNPSNSASPPVLNTGFGWVNFMPPLQQFAEVFDELPSANYYLAGAKMIVPFKDRLLFIGPVVVTASPSASPIYLPGTVLYSENGTPYYTSSYTGDPTLPTILQTAVLTPDGFGAQVGAFFTDQPGFGGFINSALDQAITTSSLNEDALILGLSGNYQLRFVYSGNDIDPFAFYIINAEYPSNAQFSAITTDQGVYSIGNKGFIYTSQTACTRFDLPILPNVFEIITQNNGNERICAQRDFINEWIYFTYVSNSQNPSDPYPDQTLLYNYRDGSWAIFNESYTSYGTIRKQSGLTWNTMQTSNPQLTWETWFDPWESFATTLQNPIVMAGNQQGFVVTRAETNTSESVSLWIQSISISSNVLTITSPVHGLNNGDFIIISGCVGTSMSQFNNVTFAVSSITANTFQVSAIVTGSPVYMGGGLITRLYVPIIMTKQFEAAWSMARKTRLGPQMYLLSMVPGQAQITLLIGLSQAGIPFNQGSIVPMPNTDNEALIFSSILYTCPESTNLGLSPANVTAQNSSLQTITNIQSSTFATSPQQQIWHRNNVSLIGDTIQFGFTLSTDQMFAVDANGYPINAFAEIEIHGLIADLNPSQMLS